jgi:hypothetical protein
VRAILPNNGWKIYFRILSIQNFHHALGGAACANWLLSKTGIFSECPGNPRFELQISDVPHGKEDLVYCYCPVLEVHFTPKLCMVCLPIMRSYIGAWSPGIYSTMSS